MGKNKDPDYYKGKPLGFDEPITEDDMPTAWTFEDETVAKKFDTHVREQLSWYESVSMLTADIALNFLPSHGTLYDLGASTGHMTRLMRDSIESKNVTAISIESSHAMAAEWAGVGVLHVMPAEDVNFKNQRPDVTIIFLTLMFLPTATREKFLKRIFKATNPGGAVLIVDKGYMNLVESQVVCKSAHTAEKHRNGTPSDSYMAKELSLRGEQRPTAKDEVEDLAFHSGFYYDEYFRFGEFYGLLCMKRSV